MQPDQTSVVDPQPTFATAPGVVSHNSVYASDDCGEDGVDYLGAKGDSLDGVDGWGDL